MQKAMERSASIAISDRDDSFSSVVSDLISLIGHVQASIKLVEAALLAESANHDNATDVAVLDDVTPCYAKANAALIACNVSLSTACNPCSTPRNGSSQATAR
jgi:hypothetical protein